MKFILPMLYPGLITSFVALPPLHGLSRRIQEDVDNIYDFEQTELERYWLTLSAWAASEQYPSHRN